MVTFTLGWQWVALQSVAWTGMFINFVQSAPVGEALKMTFDGEHPCSICHLVREGRKSRESEREPQSASQIKLLPLPVFHLALTHPEQPLPAFATDTLHAAGIPAPPKPPPRRA